MSVEEIKMAIFRLPHEERRKLIRSFVPIGVKLTASEEEQIQAEADAIPDADWVDWETIRQEIPIRPE